jgi:hypothetical protein
MMKKVVIQILCLLISAGFLVYPAEAQIPARGLPALVEKVVYQDAGGVVLDDLYSIEITNLHVESAPLTEAQLYEFKLSGSQNNEDPYDNLDDVWWMQFSVPKHTKRLVMEILKSSASDLDLFWGYSESASDVPSLETELGRATTSSFDEYLSYIDPDIYPNAWVMVQNRDEVTEPDDVTLALGLVPSPPRPKNFSVSGPKSWPASTPYDLEISWNIPAMESASAWYGWFSVGSHPNVPGNIGETELNVYRPYDDVTKTVALEQTEPGIIQSYTINVAPNFSGEDLDYFIHDVLPVGVSYIPGSLETKGTSSKAIYDEDENAVTWEGTMPNLASSCLDSNSFTNFETCDGEFVEVTFDVFVETSLEGVITNTVYYDTDNMNMHQGQTSASFQNFFNLKPIAVPQTLTTDEDMPIEIKLKGLFLYPGPVGWEVLTEPLYGKLTGTAPDLVYTPDEDFHGDDSFTFMVNDGLADSDPATITINVLSVNDAPVAVADTYETDEDTLLDVTAPGVLENDTDADGDSLTAVLVTGVSNGSLTLNADGSFSYTPNAEFIGTDSFTYKANDGEVDSTLPTTVTITVQEDGMLYYYLPLIVH